MPNRLTRGTALIGRVDAGHVAGSIFVVTSHLLAASVDRHVFVASQPCELIAVQEIHSVAGGSSAAVRPRKITANSVAPGASAGDTCIELTGAFDLTAGANTLATGTLVSTAAATFEAGDRLAEDFSGTLTNLVGQVVYTFKVL